MKNSRQKSSRRDTSSAAHSRYLLPPFVGIVFVRVIIPTLFIILAVLSFLLLHSYSALDPSLNSIGTTQQDLSQPINNTLGLVGAIIADILRQLLGITSYTLVVFNVLWAVLWLRVPLPLQAVGWKNRCGRGLLVVLCTISSMILIATLSSYPSGGDPYYGGWFGSGLLQMIQNNITPDPAALSNMLWSGVIVVSLLLLALLLFFSAARLPLLDYVFCLKFVGALLWWLSLQCARAIRRGGESSFNQLRKKQNTPKINQLFTYSAPQPEVAPQAADPAETAPHASPSYNMPQHDMQRHGAPQHVTAEAAPLATRTEPSLTPIVNPRRLEPSLEPEPTAPVATTAPQYYDVHDQPSDTVQYPPAEAVSPAPDPFVSDFLEPESLLDLAPEHEAPTQTLPINTPDMSDLAPAALPPLPSERKQAEFVLPTLDLLSDPPPHIADATSSDDKLHANARRLEAVLADFNIKGKIQQIRPGPVVTMYELEPAPGIKTTRIINLSEDIARNMRALSVRIATIPGHSALGIELPNAKRLMVNMKEILSGRGYQDSKAKLPMILGKKIDGVPLIVDLATMPHLLIAGTTGSGKSVGLNVMLLSILYRLTPDQCRIIMIDPKMLEFSVYDGIPHLLTPVVTEPKQAVVALKWTVREMENRYRLMSKIGVRNIDGFNQRIAEARERNEPIVRKIHTGYDTETGEAIYDTEEIPSDPFPLIVVVVDEMADLMIVAGKEIEASIQRLAQMARAAGIHLIMATQRPSVDVITGTIKANFPTRISYRVTSKIDSRTIIGEMGAEQLLGRGDLLLMQAAGNITRVHAPFVEDAEVEKICHWLRQQRPPSYLEDVIDEGAINQELGDVSAAMFDTDNGDSETSLYDKAVAIVAHHQKASTSFIQRQLRIGYNRAADLIDEMESQGVISPANHAGKREVLIRDFEQ